MPAVARLGDRTFGTCYRDHSGAEGLQTFTGGGTITGGSPDTYAEGKQVARRGDEVTADCGHKSKIVGGSATVYTNNKATARRGDAVADGPYLAEITGGAASVYAE